MANINPEEGDSIEIARKWYVLYTLIPETYKTPDEVALILGIDLGDLPLAATDPPKDPPVIT